MANFNATPSMSIVESIKTCYAKYLNAKGRARRSEFWWFYLVASVVNWIAMFIVRSAHTAAAEKFAGQITFENMDEMYKKAEALDSQFLVYYIIVAVVLFFCCSLPLITAQIRRLHDVGKSGHFMWLYLLCGIGGLIPLILCIADGKPEPNQYGESPKFVNPGPAAPAAPAI